MLHTLKQMHIGLAVAVVGAVLGSSFLHEKTLTRSGHPPSSSRGGEATLVFARE